MEWVLPKKLNEEHIEKILKPEKKEPDDISKKLDKKRPKMHEPAPAKTRETPIGDFLLQEFYEKARLSYQKILAEYLKEATTSIPSSYDYQPQDQPEFHWGDELITYKERIEIARKMMLNSLMHGNHNDISPREKERYENWKYASKFNLMMSFMMYDSALS